MKCIKGWPILNFRLWSIHPGKKDSEQNQLKKLKWNQEAAQYFTAAKMKAAKFLATKLFEHYSKASHKTWQLKNELRIWSASIWAAVWMWTLQLMLKSLNVQSDTSRKKTTFLRFKRVINEILTEAWKTHLMEIDNICNYLNHSH